MSHRPTPEDRAAALAAGERIMREGASLPPDELARLTQIHRRGLVSPEPDEPISDTAARWQRGVFASESTPTHPEDDREQLRRIRATHAYADELARLRETAADFPRAEAEERLVFLELEEADASGKLKFGLSDQERAAAELVRRDRDYRRDLHAAADAVIASNQKTNPDAAAELSEQTSPIYGFLDAHGARLLCVDDAIFGPNPNHR